MQDVPTREIYWNIPGHNILYALFIVALFIFVYGFYRKYRLWRLGQPENRFDHMGKRVFGLIKDGIVQASVLREKTPGIMHAAIFSGFVILFIGTLLVFAQADFSIQILFGRFYLWYSLILDLFGVVFILGVLFAIFRRYVLRPSRLNRLLDDAVILPLLLIIAVTGFLVEGARMAGTQELIHQPEWAAWSPVGQVVAGWFSSATEHTVETTHRLLWWFHLIISMGFIAYIPYSKLFHLIVSPANLYFKSFQPRGQLSSIDIENSETFGVTDIQEFTWKQLFDLDACTHCGRCQDQCPAYTSDKPLSPKKLILDLQAHLKDRGNAFLQSKKQGIELEPDPITGKAVTEDELWACTTCMACQEHCPVAIEHVQKVVDLRRSQVLMESQFPQELNLAFRGLETNANPWNMGHASRADWAIDLDVPSVNDNPEVDYFWFVGCAGSFDDRAKAVSKAFVQILNKSGVSYAILGTEEKCCGDPARRAGNEYVFQIMAEENIENFKACQFKKIVTSCPHCYNVIRNEYPQFGGDFEIIHHTELIVELIKNDRLSLKGNGKEMLAFHDSCYLGRYHDIYEAPREVLNKLANGKIKELSRNREKSFCCGGGGGRMFMEETIGTRINHLRIEEAQQAGLDTLGVACPFCLTMLDDAVKEKELTESLQVKDIAQMVVERIR